MGVAALDKSRDDVAAHVVAAVGVLGILAQRVYEGIRRENIIAHRGEEVVPSRRQSNGVGRLFDETLDQRPLARFDYAKTACLLWRHPVSPPPWPRPRSRCAGSSIWRGSIR